MSPARFVERFDLATPRFALAIIDLAEIQNRTLHHTTTCTASAFDNAPVTVLLAVLPSPRESQVHGSRFYAQPKSGKEGRSSLHAFPPHRPLKRFSFCRQNSKIGAPVGKVRLAVLRLVRTVTCPPVAPAGRPLGGGTERRAMRTSGWVRSPCRYAHLLAPYARRFSAAAARLRLPKCATTIVEPECTRRAGRRAHRQQAQPEGRLIR